MNEKYMFAKNLVRQKYSYMSNIENLLILGIYGLLSVYNNYQKIIKKVFLDTDILFEHGTVNQILDRHHIEFADFKFDEDGISNYSKVHTIYNKGPYVYIEDDNIKVGKEKTFIAISTDNTDMTVLLNSFVHEMGHIIKGYTKNCSLKDKSDKKYAFIRTGLCLDALIYNKLDGEYYNYKIMEALDETINVIQTTEALKEIKKLGNMIPDEDVQLLFNSLNMQLLDKDLKHTKLVSVIKPLWECDSFRKLIEENIVEGRLLYIKKYFDKNTYCGAFNKLSNLLDDILEVEYNGGDLIIEFVSIIKIRRIINIFKKNNVSKEKNVLFKLIDFC